MALGNTAQLLQALTIDPERVLALHAMGIFGNSMPRDLVMSRHKGRWQGHDELRPIPRISRRNPSGNCFTGFILEFYARKSRYHAFAKIQLDLREGDLAGNISRGAGRYYFRMSVGRSSKGANRQNCESAYRHRLPRHTNSFPCKSDHV